MTFTNYNFFDEKTKGKVLGWKIYVHGNPI